MTIYVQVDNMSEVQMPRLQTLGIEKSKEKFVNQNLIDNISESS